MSIDWQEMDRLDAFGTFGGRIVPYNGTWKIYLNETNSELWSLKTHPEAEAKLAEAIKQSGYSDDENPLVELARLKAARPEGKPTKLWLWKNFVDDRPEYWAFDNPYPTHGGGDPMTLGEPCGYAIFKESTVAPGRVDVPESEVIAAIKRAAHSCSECGRIEWRHFAGCSQYGLNPSAPSPLGTPTGCQHRWIYVANPTGQPYWQCEQCLAATNTDPMPSLFAAGDRQQEGK